MKRRTQKAKKCSFLQNILHSAGVLESRAGRAGEILNPFRGLSLKNSFPLSPFSMDEETEIQDESKSFCFVHEKSVKPSCYFQHGHTH